MRAVAALVRACSFAAGARCSGRTGPGRVGAAARAPPRPAGHQAHRIALRQYRRQAFPELPAAGTRAIAARGLGQPRPHRVRIRPHRPASGTSTRTAPRPGASRSRPRSTAPLRGAAARTASRRCSSPRIWRTGNCRRSPRRRHGLPAAVLYRTPNNRRRGAGHPGAARGADGRADPRRRRRAGAHDGGAGRRGCMSAC